jgi:hypothetical protein
MGPFELQDLVGIDVGFEVSKAFHELSFGEPRWRPSPLQARMAASGRLGRKTGHGWYAYDADGRPVREPDPPAPDAEPGDGLIVVAGSSELAVDLIEAAAEAGWDVAPGAAAAGEVAWLGLDCGRDDDEPPLEGGPAGAAVRHRLPGHAGGRRSPRSASTRSRPSPRRGSSSSRAARRRRTPRPGAPSTSSPRWASRSLGRRRAGT